MGCKSLNRILPFSCYTNAEHLLNFWFMWMIFCCLLVKRWSVLGDWAFQVTVYNKIVQKYLKFLGFTVEDLGNETKVINAPMIYNPFKRFIIDRADSLVHLFSQKRTYAIQAKTDFLIGTPLNRDVSEEDEIEFRSSIAPVSAANSIDLSFLCTM